MGFSYKSVAKIYSKFYDSFDLFQIQTFPSVVITKLKVMKNVIVECLTNLVQIPVATPLTFLPRI